MIDSFILKANLVISLTRLLEKKYRSLLKAINGTRTIVVQYIYAFTTRPAFAQFNVLVRIYLWYALIFFAPE